MDREIDVANSPYVTRRVGVRTLSNTVLNFTQFLRAKAATAFSAL